MGSCDESGWQAGDSCAGFSGVTNGTAENLGGHERCILKGGDFINNNNNNNELITFTLHQEHAQVKQVFQFLMERVFGVKNSTISITV